MKLFNKVRGTMELIPNIEVNIDTVYIRSNIIAITETDFTGWEYDEIQYGKDEYTEVTNTIQVILEKTQILQTDRLGQMEEDTMAFQDYILATLGGI